MHILVFPSFYPSTVRPITGIFFRDQVNALRRAGHTVRVLVGPRLRETLYHLRQHRQWPAVSEDEDQLLRMHRGWFPRIFPGVSAVLHKRAGRSAYERYVQHYGKPDVIHAHNFFYAGFMAGQISEHHGVPVVITEHSTNFLRGRIFLAGQHRIVADTAQNSAQVIAVGKSLADHLQDRYGMNVIVVPNVIDTDFFQPTPPPNGTFVFALVARLFKIKNVPLLLDAFAEAFGPTDNVRLSIAGDGPAREQLEQQSIKLGISDNVTFCGKLLRDDVRDLYQNCHAVVSSSRIETFGVTMIEAMACGRPVVATRSGGPDGFVTPQTGIIVDQTVAALSEGLRQLYQHYTDYDPATIRGYCVDNFSEHAIAQQLEQIYEGVINSS